MLHTRFANTRPFWNGYLARSITETWNLTKYGNCMNKFVWMRYVNRKIDQIDMQNDEK